MKETSSEHQLSLEGGFPIHENLNGPQLSTDFQFIAGWQSTF